MPKTSSSEPSPPAVQMSLFGAPPARTSPSPESELEWMALVATWPSSALALLGASGPAGWSSRTCPVSCPLTAEAQKRSVRFEIVPNEDAPISEPAWTVRRTVTSPPSSPPFANSAILDATEFLMLSLPAYHSGAVASSLSDILEKTGDVGPQYYLTPRACAGILRRAEKRGKELPEQLRRALETAAGRPAPTETSPAKPSSSRKAAGSTKKKASVRRSKRPAKGAGTGRR